MMKTSRLARAGLIASMYVVLNLLLPFGYGPIQFRLSEALCILPILYSESVWGVFVGCFVANLLGLGLGMTTPWDVLVGPIATLLAAVWTARCKSDWTAPLPPVICNALLIGTMLTVVYFPQMPLAMWGYHIVSVGLSELVVMYVFGLPLVKVLRKLKWKQE